MTAMILIATARSTYADSDGRPDGLPEGLHNPLLPSFLLGPDAVFRCGGDVGGGRRGGPLGTAARRTATRRTTGRTASPRIRAWRQVGQLLGSRGCHDDIRETGRRTADIR